MSRRVFSGGRVIGGTASRASVLTFISVPKPTILQRHSVFQGGSSTSGRPPRRSASIFFELLQIERLVVGVSLKTAIDRVAGITNGNFTDKTVSKKVN